MAYKIGNIKVKKLKVVSKYKLNIMKISRIKFKEVLDNVVPLTTLPNSSFHIVNVVGIVHLLNPGEGVCIELLSLYLGGMVKYAPKRFAAAILRIKDIISTTTCLVFRSGKLVCVGALTKYHSLLACQMYRQLIELVVGVYREKISNTLRNTNLQGRTQFVNWGIQNIVAHDDLKCKPNLKYITDVIPEIADWNPELFPGLKLLVWIKPKNNCFCIKKKKNKSCKCNLRVLLFDTGKYVATGCIDTQSILHGANIIKNIFSDDTYKESSSSLLSNSMSKFELRKEKIKAAAYIEFAGYRSYKKTTIHEANKTTAITTNNIDSLLKGLKKVPKKKGVKVIDEEEEAEELLMTPFLKACKYDQFDNVKFLSSYNKEAARDALNYCELNEETFPKRIMTILKQNAL
jgi:TATA-box binding protein (TBP) (component of TFIID and TFIIIB)